MALLWNFHECQGKAMAMPRQCYSNAMASPWLSLALRIKYMEERKTKSGAETPNDIEPESSLHLATATAA
jgi:hypothetical protein